MSLFRRRRGGTQFVQGEPPIRVSPVLAQNPQTAREPIDEPVCWRGHVGCEEFHAERRVRTPTATPTGSHQGLTEAEHQAIEMTAKLWDHLALFVIDQGPSAVADCAELGAHVHAIQRAVLANAAARAYPDLYRRLGSTIDGKPA